MTKVGDDALEMKEDFSHVTSREMAEELFQQGQLERVLLFPEMLGGEDVPPNVVYVPVGFADAKTIFDNAVEKLFEDGKVSRYRAEPKYEGGSKVPRRLMLRAWTPDQPGSFEAELELW